MKKLITIFFTACIILAVAYAMPTYAAEPENAGTGEPSTVIITVVIPDAAAAQDEEPATAAPEHAFTTATAATAPISVYPSDVTEIRDGSGWQIVKTYELNNGEDPADIPREPFERSGWSFALTDIIRTEASVAETRGHTETVTLETETKELETILPLLSPTMEYRDEDGFVGILSLGVASIAVETAGTRTSSYTMSVTREFPHLSTNDTGLVPKTVTDRGTTYTLANVDWRAGNTVTVDYTALPEYYTAIATYTATGTSTRVTGYTTTAEYTGTLAKLSQGRTIYTAYFLGEEIHIPLEIVVPSTSANSDILDLPEPEESDETVVPAPGDDNGEFSEDGHGEEPAEDPQAGGEERKLNPAYLVIIPCAGVMAGGAYYSIKKRKGKTKNEEIDNAATVAADDNGDGSTGTGG